MKSVVVKTCCLCCHYAVEVIEIGNLFFLRENDQELISLGRRIRRSLRSEVGDELHVDRCSVEGKPDEMKDE